MRALVIFFFSFWCLYVNAENIKIGFIDTEQVVVNLSQYKQSVDKIASEFEPKKQELLDLFKHIELIRASVEASNKSGNLDSNEIELSKLTALEESFKKETEFWQKTMNNKKVNLLKKIERLVNTTINEFAIKEDYDLILYKDIAFVSDKVNITQQIIDEIEKLFP
ncbi:OmpH family outer membrane protein [Candidatus Pseudothioglobus singularis]|jgi:outer membrane protein|nr:OmpH family outer membrane protein [Candidatus Pseudothioglobus singularis]